jgi:cold-inducible RNA-binding protein
MGNNLFVTGFPYELTQEGLGKLFADCGSVVSAKILMERETGRSRGIGFVVMATDAEARAAIAKLNGSPVGHRRMFVNEARPADKPGAGGYSGPERRSGKDRRRGPPAVAAGASGKSHTWEKKPWDKDKKPGFGDKKPWEKKPWDKDRKPGFGDKKPWKKPWEKDKKPGGFGAKKPWEKKPWDKMHGSGGKRDDFGPKKKWSAGGPNSGRKPGDFKSKPGGFKRKPGGGFRG